MFPKEYVLRAWPSRTAHWSSSSAHRDATTYTFGLMKKGRMKRWQITAYSSCPRSSKKLQKDIYGLGDPGAKVAVIRENLACCLPEELRYACTVGTVEAESAPARISLV
jgi:hypothetical protein